MFRDASSKIIYVYIQVGYKVGFEQKERAEYVRVYRLFFGATGGI